jgi:hypothetical protein
MGVLFSIILSANCLIDYKDFPKADPLNESQKVNEKKLVYNLPYFPAFNLGGREAMEFYFSSKTQFKNTEMGTEVPLDGYFVDVKVDYISPTPPALVFLTASTLTATLLPAWSFHDGYSIRYDLYKDSKKVETFSYKVERKYGQWLPLIFVIWLNVETSTEKSVFERTTQQFFKDANSYF